MKSPKLSPADLSRFRYLESRMDLSEAERQEYTVLWVGCFDRAGSHLRVAIVGSLIALAATGVSFSLAMLAS